jgi:hypothetical protein
MGGMSAASPDVLAPEPLAAVETGLVKWRILVETLPDLRRFSIRWLVSSTRGSVDDTPICPP